jgi:hypothetical protein
LAFEHAGDATFGHAGVSCESGLGAVAGVASTLGRGDDDCGEALRVRGWGGIGPCRTHEDVKRMEEMWIRARYVCQGDVRRWWT